MFILCCSIYASIYMQYNSYITKPEMHVVMFHCLYYIMIIRGFYMKQYAIIIFRDIKKRSSCQSANSMEPGQSALRTHFQYSLTLNMLDFLNGLVHLAFLELSIINIGGIKMRIPCRPTVYERLHKCAGGKG